MSADVVCHHCRLEAETLCDIADWHFVIEVAGHVQLIFFKTFQNLDPAGWSLLGGKAHITLGTLLDKSK